MYCLFLITANTFVPIILEDKRSFTANSSYTLISNTPSSRQVTEQKSSSAAHAFKSITNTLCWTCKQKCTCCQWADMFINLLF